MVLIDCYECGLKVSDKAFSCPHCGCPPIDASDSLIEKPIISKSEKRARAPREQSADPRKYLHGDIKAEFDSSERTAFNKSDMENRPQRTSWKSFLFRLIAAFVVFRLILHPLGCAPSDMFR